MEAVLNKILRHKPGVSPEAHDLANQLVTVFSCSHYHRFDSFSNRCFTYDSCKTPRVALQHNSIGPAVRSDNRDKNGTFPRNDPNALSIFLRGASDSCG